MTEALLLARVADRLGALERVLGLIRRRMLAVRRLSVGFGEGTLDVVLRVDQTRTPCDRVRAELLSLVDVEEVTDLDAEPDGRTRELALAELRPGNGAPLPTEFVRPLSQQSDGVVVEITGTPGEVDAALARLRTAGLLFRSTRSGEVALPARPRDPTALIPGGESMSSVRMFGQQDVDRSALSGRRVAVIGYGSQGHAHALNLRDSGIPVVVGLRPDGRSAARAREAGFDVPAVRDAVAASDVIAVLVPDTEQAVLYRDHIAPALKPGSALLFAHGFNVHYCQIQPPGNVDTVMVAPKSPGAMVRREFEAGRGVPALLAVHHDGTGRARGVALAYADALGCTRAGVLETTFAAETETDLFGEQAVLCGGLTALIKAGFETLVEAGYAPELAYFECLHEMKLIVDLIYAGGLTGMRAGVSDTAEYGDYVSGERVVGERGRAAMAEILAEIRSGAFARRWIAEAASGAKEFKRMRERGRAHEIEAVGQRLRGRMAWLGSPAAGR